MEIRRLFDILTYQHEQYPQEKAFGYRYQGQWKYFSTDESVELVQKAAQGLIELGVQPGDKIALLAYQNRPEWVFMDQAALQVGAITVPVYPTISPAEYQYIFNEAEVSMCFCGKDDLISKVKTAQKDLPKLKAIYAFDETNDAPHWTSIFSNDHGEALEKRKANVNYEDLATIIYTSGTTGNPKGVMLSHKNIISNIMSVSQVFPVSTGERVLSFLPLCHIFERTAYYSYTYFGINITFTGTDNLGGEEGDLAAIKPHFFTTVPRLLEKVYERIYNRGLALDGVKKKLFFWALSLTDGFEYQNKYTGLDGIKRSIANKLIFSKWQAALGGEIKGILTGAAPCPAKIIRVFSAAGIPVREAYGLTEASPGITFNQFDNTYAKIGSTGPALEGVEVKIDETGGDYREGEGEILAAGDNIMMGYYKKPEETAKVIREENGKRWLLTGDVGRLSPGPNGRDFLFITDRKKELLKTSGGKYVAPAPIESRLKENFLVEQAMIIGDKQKFVSALIIPAVEALKDWCSNNGVNWTTRAEVIKNPAVLAEYQRAIDEVNPHFSHIEQVKKFELIDGDWDTTKSDGSDAELTPTMKLKRRVILKKYADHIDAIYN